MANKYLHRFIMRSRLLFFTPTGARRATSATAAYKLLTMQGLSYRLQGSYSLPSSSAAYNSSADEDNYISAPEEEEEEDEEDQRQQLARSHSCSNLQCKQLAEPSFKSLLQRAASSHSHLHAYGTYQSQSSCKKLHDFEEESSSKLMTRCRSAPASLHIGRAGSILKLPQKARSFCSSRQSMKEVAGKKRAPRGHVAVYVEAGRERQVVPIAYLSHPYFQALLERARSEFGFRQEGPGLRIPCSLSELHHTLLQIRNATHHQ